MIRHKRRSRLFAAGAVAVTTALAGSLLTQTVPQAAAAPSPAPKADEHRAAPSAVPADERDATLGKDHRSSDDTAFRTSSEADGFHLLTADVSDGYAWKTVAVLAEPGFEADMWIGNACVTSSGRRAAVTYAPRTFTNEPELMTRGAFTAVVDLTTGEVTKLPHQGTLGYFSPSCGTGESAVFSQFTDDESEKNATRLIRVDAESAKADKPIELPGQVTSAVPVEDGFVAARGSSVVKVSARGRMSTVAQTAGVPFQLKADRDGGVTFIDPTDIGKKSRASVKRVTAAQIGKPNGKNVPRELASGGLTEFDLTRSASGTVFVTGEARNTGKLPSAVANPGGIAKGAVASTHGRAVVETTWTDGKETRSKAEDIDTADDARTRIHVVKTGKTVTLDARPVARIGDRSEHASGMTLSPALPSDGDAGKAGASSVGITADPNNPVEAERTCSVPRNNSDKQAFQPTPRQIEWAVNQAITGDLDKHVSRPADWKGTNMPAYRPQDLFPLRALSGGGHIPAQIMLGITAQESNMWQATRFAVPGVTANSLIGNFYGISYSSDGEQHDPWAIDWSEADCGYGVTQVTDGMRLPGKGQPTMTTTQQEAVALDYTANIAAGVNILVEKWNQTRAAGMTVNGGSPEYIENWFFALWAYNSGFYPESTAGQHGGHWGVGFTNNPANPLWKANRTPFLEDAYGGDDYSHAAHPQDWPYQEKVIGWAARPISAMFAPGDFQPGYRAAWWTSTDFRTTAKPPIGLFCDASNHCDPSKIREGDSNDPGQGACQLDDPGSSTWLHCWWNKPVEWKNCESAAQCGFPLHRFNDTYPEQPDANSYPPRCNSGLPSGTYIVDNLPNGTRPAGSDSRSCGTVSSSGSFRFTFTNWNGTYPGKIDTHQIGAGYGNHFWFSHTRDRADEPRMHITGKWTLGRDLNWARVMVHLPDHGAHTRQATYVVGGTDSTSPRRVKPQRVLENKWVSLGVFRFTGTPSVTLSTHTQDGTGEEDVAWDAVAFQPLSSKPANLVVGMGDSYSSGEGASDPGGEDYYRESDYYSESRPETENRCHRSRYAWIRQAAIPGYSSSIGELSDRWSSSTDLQFVACSGARHYNILRTGQNGELPQIQHGYLDQHTSLVALSIGGNDARFADVIMECITALTVCNNNSIDAVDPDTGRKIEGQETGPMDEWAPKWLNEQIRPRLADMLGELHRKAPNAEIVLMGYPKLLEGLGQCVLGVGTEEAPWLNEVADVLANEMKGAVADANREHNANAVFSDPRDEFAGKAICGDPETVHGIVLSGHSEADNRDWEWLPGNVAPSMKSFHPKIAGARLYADSLQNTLRGS